MCSQGLFACSLSAPPRPATSKLCYHKWVAFRVAPFMALALLCIGCTFDRTGLRADDRGRPGLEPSFTLADLTFGDDDRSDGAADHSVPPDTGAPPPDTGTPPPDTGAPPPDTSAPPSCASVFKPKVPGYVLCKETADSCRFYFDGIQTMSCSQVCGSHPCLKAEDNEPGHSCTLEKNMSCGGGPCTCTYKLGDGICTCAK